jgi:hypothetical protein
MNARKEDQTSYADQGPDFLEKSFHYFHFAINIPNQGWGCKGEF